MVTRTTPVAPRPGSDSGDEARHGRSPAAGDVLREVGFAAAALACYLAVGWYTRDATAAAVGHARDVLSLERLLGIDWEHSVQDATLAVPALTTLLTQFYVWGYFPSLVVLVIWLFVRARPAYRMLRNALVVSGVVGLLVYAAYPCAPPWIGGSGFADPVTTSAVEAVARPQGITNHLGALPSFHVGWVVLVAWAVGSAVQARTVRVLCALYPALMAYAVVATGNHWVLDVPAGVLLSLTGIVGASMLGRRGAIGRSVDDQGPSASGPGTVKVE